MNTDEILTLQALKFKQLHVQGHSLPADFVEQLIDQHPEVKAKMRNICAFIDPSLFEKVENLCGILDLSKRQFVEMALQDFVQKAGATIDRFDAMPEGK